MDSGFYFYFEFLLKKNERYENLRCQLISCLKQLNNERHQNITLRRQYLSHTQSTNSNSIDNLSLQPIKNAALDISDGVVNALYECDNCDYASSAKQNLENHVKRIHVVS